MSSIKSILVIVDPTAKAHPAIEKAAQIATRFDARVELFACETKESRAMRVAAHVASGRQTDFNTDLRSVLGELAQPLKDRHIDVCVEATSGDPLHVQLLARIQRTCADLVVKDTHHHSLTRRTFITHTDWHLIRGCPVPLLLTKEKPWAVAPLILAAVDPGHVNDKPAALDRRILDWAEMLRAGLKGSLQLIHAYLPMTLIAEAAAGVPPMISVATPKAMEEDRTRALDHLVSLGAPYGIDPRWTRVRIGVASEVIPSFADEVNADIVAMGAISRSALQRLFVGSTAERVLERLPCDILVVKPPEFELALPEC
jgi:universal stress protein E